jgi:hypothetical protein
MTYQKAQSEAKSRTSSLNSNTFHGTRRFTTVCRSPPLRPNLSQKKPYYTPTSISLRSNLILSFHLPSDQAFRLKFCLHLPSLQCVLHAPSTSPSEFIILIMCIYGEYYKFRSPSLCTLLQHLTTSSLLGPNYLLSILFSNSLNILSRDSVTIDRFWIDK